MLHAMRCNAWERRNQVFGVRNPELEPRKEGWEVITQRHIASYRAPEAAFGRRDLGRPALADIVVGYFWAVLQWPHGHRSAACPLQYHPASLAPGFPLRSRRVKVCDGTLRHWSSNGRPGRRELWTEGVKLDAGPQGPDWRCMEAS